MFTSAPAVKSPLSLGTSIKQFAPAKVLRRLEPDPLCVSRSGQTLRVLSGCRCRVGILLVPDDAIPGWSRSPESAAAGSVHRTCRLGFASSRQVAMVDTGLPGQNQQSPILPKANGLPGFNSAAKDSSPKRAMVAPMKSASPTDTPPLVISMSHRRLASASAASTALGSWVADPA